MKKMKNLSKSTLISIIFACVILIIGVIFCCSLSFGAQVLSYIIGISLMVIGAIFLFDAIYSKRTLLNANGMISAVAVAFGVMIMIRNLASLLIDYIPWLMISVGVLLIVDAFVRKFIKKNLKTVFMVLEIVLGAIVTASGFCVKFIDGWADFAALVLGVALIAYAVYVIFSVLNVQAGKHAK